MIHNSATDGQIGPPVEPTWSSHRHASVNILCASRAGAAVPWAMEEEWVE